MKNLFIALMFLSTSAFASVSQIEFENTASPGVLETEVYSVCGEYSAYGVTFDLTAKKLKPGVKRRAFYATIEAVDADTDEVIQSREFNGGVHDHPITLNYFWLVPTTPADAEERTWHRNIKFRITLQTRNGGQYAAKTFFTFGNQGY